MVGLRQFAEECPGVAGYFRRPGETLPEATAAALKGLSNVGFESTNVTVALAEKLGDLAKATEFRGTAGVVEALRAIKDETEIATLRTAVRVAEDAYRALLKTIQPHDTEKQLADRLDHLMRQGGAECAAFPPIIAVGDRAGLPHAIPGAAQVRSNDFTLIDWGARVGLYHSDCTRMVVTGKITAELRKIHGIVQAAQALAIAALRPGARAADVDGLVRKHMDSHGLGPAFGHGLGHGVGRHIHEAPQFRPESQDVLQPGMVVTVEPGLYLEGWGGVRLEDMALITPDGCELLTALPLALEACVLGAGAAGDC